MQGHDSYLSVGMPEYEVAPLLTDFLKAECLQSTDNLSTGQWSKGSQESDLYGLYLNERWAGW